MIKGKKTFCIVPSWETHTHNAFFDEFCEKNKFLKITPLEIYKQKNFLLILEYLKGGFIVFCRVLLKITTKKGDFRKTKYDSINLGFSINERAISRSKLGNPSIFLVLKYAFYIGFKYIILRDFLNKFKVGFILAGDEAYPDFSILLQLANIKNIKSKAIKGGPIAYICEFQPKILSAFPDKEIYNKTLKIINKKLLIEYEEILKKRIANIREDLFYMDKEPLKRGINLNKLMTNAIWIYQHDFFDSPGVYGDNLFLNHYEWLIKTVLYCRDNSINFYIKAHPNNRKNSKYALSKFTDIYNLENNIIFEDLSLIEIKSTAPIAICSVYGSIIPEALYAGIPVINCGSNPYETFPISYRAFSLENYFELINKASLGNLKVPEKQKILETFICGKKFLSNICNSFDISWDDINRELWSSYSIDGKYPKYWDRNNINLNKINTSLYQAAKKLIKEKNLNFNILLK